MELAGHKVIETTLGFYTHTSSPVLNEAIANLETFKTKKSNVSMIGHNSRKQLK